MGRSGQPTSKANGARGVSPGIGTSHRWSTLIPWILQGGCHQRAHCHCRNQRADEARPALRGCVSLEGRRTGRRHNYQHWPSAQSGCVCSDHKCVPCDIWKRGDGADCSAVSSPTHQDQWAAAHQGEAQRGCCGRSGIQQASSCWKGGWKGTKEGRVWIWAREGCCAKVR